MVERDISPLAGADDLGHGTLIGGRYRLMEHLGEGGMGTVWSALHVVTRRAVAMKFLRAGVQNKKNFRKRFVQEARAASALRHPNVIEVLDVFELEDQSPAMVMELLEGETLASKLAREERLSVEETAAIMLPVVTAVACAHGMGIVHRDLKPDNIFLARTTESATVVKVLDFGIAKLSAEHYIDLSQAVALTDSGCVLGTPTYMAPEQIGNRGVDHRADIWSIGTILYECLSGTRPIDGENLAEVMGRLLGGVIVPLAELAPNLPRELAALVQQMLARDAKRRPNDLEEVGQLLRHHARLSGVAPISANQRRESGTGGMDGALRTVHAAPRDSTLSRMTAPQSGHDRAPGRVPHDVHLKLQADPPSPPKARSKARLIWLGAACLLLLALGVLSTFANGRSSRHEQNVKESLHTMPKTKTEPNQVDEIPPPAVREVAPPLLSTTPAKGSVTLPARVGEKRAAISAPAPRPDELLGAQSEAKPEERPTGEATEEMQFSGRK